jgi:dolichol-phosphate mannosyltransferase
VIPALYHKLQEGYDVVYAKRSSRQGETWAKRVIASVGYYLINRLSDIPIPRDTGDFRIITRRVIEELKKLGEAHAFLKGLVAFVGFKQAAVLYERDARYNGKGKYNPWVGSLKIGLNGLIGFSTKPLQLMSLLGLLIAGGSFLLGLWYLIQKLLGFPLTPGLSTMVLVVSFFSGVQLVALGLMGEYIGRIYDEVKRRPLYIIERSVNFQK